MKCISVHRAATRVRSGHGKSGKSMDFVLENSRPGNSMEVDEKFWKEVESFGKFLFRKGCFSFFFRAGARSRRSRPPGLGEASGEAMHVRPDRVMSWSVGSLPIQAGAGSTCACNYFNSNFHVDRVHRLEHATVITRTVKTTKKADGMLLIVFRFSWLGRGTVIHFYFGSVQFSVKRKFAVSVRRKFWSRERGPESVNLSKNLGRDLI